MTTRNDLFGVLIVCGTFIIAIQILTDAAVKAGWGVVFP